ncbi:hypothetical protein AVEN_122059-1 [Araneus ventricosus]|uniref:Uncharacterized protein n=1 Tax=Araneus ventricosus TaxID=182803 RepID=A0A4Y2F3L1_ARAVE|nr:hypothetical protein AVEN_122059-1 [Araneus ventricosus]
MERCISEIYHLLSAFNWLSGYLVSFRTGRSRALSWVVLVLCVCNASLLQVRPMVTSRLALTCCKIVSPLSRDKFAESLQICSASLLQTKIAIWVFEAGHSCKMIIFHI